MPTTLLEALRLAEQAQQWGDIARAKSIYLRILEAAPEEPRTHNALGVLAYEAGELDVAESHLQRAIAAFDGEASFHNNLHLVYRRQGRLADATASCRRALELAPESPELFNNLGVLLKDTGDLEAAVVHFERSIALKPDFADSYYNLGNALTRLRRLDDAERQYRRAIELQPGDCETHNNLGTLVELQGRLDEAMACYDTALQSRDDSPEAHRNRALLKLLLGNYTEGWAEYEWRWRMPGTSRPPCPQPQWTGQRLDGGTILLIMEQGLGDTIQFVRYAPLVKQRSAARVMLLCSRSWHALLRTAPQIDHLVAPEDNQRPFDCYVPLLSLPMILGTTVESIPRPVPYLAAEPERVEHWRQKFASVGEFKVGIAWQGSPGFTGDYYRSIPLEHFARLADCSGVRLFSLQKGFGSEQLQRLPAGAPIEDLGATLDEGTGAFVDTAAVMKNLDLVITSDTAVAHLAGALGVPVWVALQVRPNWRWFMGRDDSPWYPTMRLFRQSRLGDWTDVFTRIATELQMLSSRGKS